VYLREAALSQKGVQHIPSVNLNAAHELGPIGVNLNQQTRALNRLVTMLREGAAEPDETVARLENLLEEFRPTLERLSERVAQLQLNLLGVPR
jgi:thioredoxin-like negative regulator of GroEL